MKVTLSLVLPRPSASPLSHDLSPQARNGWSAAAAAAAAAESNVPLPGGPTAAAAVRRRKSAWLAERERIMAEWGAFALSGLVLADA